MPDDMAGRPFEAGRRRRGHGHRRVPRARSTAWPGTPPPPPWAEALLAEPVTIVVDLLGVSYMDSTGINCLLEAKPLAAARQAHRAADRFGAAHPGPRVDRAGRILRDDRRSPPAQDVGAGGVGAPSNVRAWSGAAVGNRVCPGRSSPVRGPRESEGHRSGCLSEHLRAGESGSTLARPSGRGPRRSRPVRPPLAHRHPRAG
jgi:hypothetical protein